MTLRLGAALALLLTAVAPAHLRATTGPVWTEYGPELPPVEVHAERAPLRPPGMAHEQRAEDMERRSARTVAEAVAADAAVQVHRQSRGEPSMTVAGFDERELVLTVDGVPFTLPYDGKVHLGAVPTAWLAGLRVEKGPAAMRSGAAGLGGALRLELRKPGDGPAYDAQAEAWVRDGGRFDAVYSGREGAVGWLLGGGIAQYHGPLLSESFTPTPNEGGGRRDNDDRRLGHLVARAGWDIDTNHRISATALFLDGTWGVPPSTRSRQPRWWRFTTWRAGLETLRYTGRPAPDLLLDATLWSTQFHNTLDAYDDASYTSQTTSGAFQSTFQDTSVGGTIRAELGPALLAVGELAGAVAVDTSFHHHRSVPDRGAATKEVASVQLAARPELRWELPGMVAVILQGNLAGDLPDEAENGRAIFGWGLLVGVEVHPDPSVLVELNAGRTLRFPTLKERFSETPGARIATPELAPESAWTVRLGAAWRPAPWLTWSVTGFDAEVRDLIEDKVVAPGVEQLVNVGRARLAGLETTLVVTPVVGLELRASYAFLHARRLWGADAGPLPHRPEHRFVGEITWVPWGPLELSTLVTVVGPQESFDRLTSGTATLGSYARLDAGLTVRPDAVLSFWLRVHNLLDMSFETAWGFPEPGREVLFGARLQW